MPSNFLKPARLSLFVTALAISTGYGCLVNAGSTGWIDRDNPSGKGDYEMTANIFRIECRIKGTNQPVDMSQPMPGYFKDKERGCWCDNKLAKNQCKDIEINYNW